MHRKSRRHSALLLLVAPLVVIGSSFLVAGSAGAAVKSRAVHPTIRLCGSVAGIHFSVNGKAMVLKSACATVTAKSGINHVVETSAPAAYRDITSISVSPSKARVTTSTRTATAVVRLATKGSVTVKFVNAKITHQAGDGYIEVCKNAAHDHGGWFVAGSFPVTITDGGTTITTTVPLGSCSLPYLVPAGTATIVEGAEAPYFLEAVTASPSIALGTVNFTTQTVPVTVTTNVDTTVWLWNSTNLNDIKVCKILSNNLGNLAGTTFWFDISWSFTTPTGAGTYTGSGEVGVTAVAAPGGNCAVFTDEWGKPIGLPIGTVVTVTEESNPSVNTTVTMVDIVPPTSNDGSTATTAMFTVAPVGVTAAEFTNEPMSYVEVCKEFNTAVGAAPSAAYNAAFSANFQVDGLTPVTVAGGACSAPMLVPAATATSVTELGVFENNDPSLNVSGDFFISDVSTLSASDPLGLRLLSAPSANPASVATPYGGVGNETVVTFTNTVAPSQFKICVDETSADANLVGQTVTFTYWFEGGSPGTVYLTLVPLTQSPDGLVCSGLIAGPLSINPDSSTNDVTVTETGITGAGAVQVTNITYAGNGSVDSLPSFPADLPASITFDTGGGINVVTFTDGRTA